MYAYLITKSLIWIRKCTFLEKSEYKDFLEEYQQSPGNNYFWNYCLQNKVSIFSCSISLNILTQMCSVPWKVALLPRRPGRRSLWCSLSPSCWWDPALSQGSPSPPLLHHPWGNNLCKYIITPRYGAQLSKWRINSKIIIEIHGNGIQGAELWTIITL